MDWQTSVVIDAPPARVWAVMTDIERWPEWTASVTKVERFDALPLAVGSRAKLKQPRFPAMEWRVTALEDGKSFEWEARTPGSHSVASHVVVDDGDGRSRVTLGVRQTGALATLLRPIFSPMTERYLRMEAEGLKARSESGAN